MYFNFHASMCPPVRLHPGRKVSVLVVISILLKIFTELFLGLELSETLAPLGEFFSVLHSFKAKKVLGFEFFSLLNVQKPTSWWWAHCLSGAALCQGWWSQVSDVPLSRAPVGTSGTTSDAKRGLHLSGQSSGPCLSRAHPETQPFPQAVSAVSWGAQPPNSSLNQALR